MATPMFLHVKPRDQRNEKDGALTYDLVPVRNTRRYYLGSEGLRGGAVLR